MIKLVTQFDNEKSRMALATPTCGACSCCCCCCLISTLAVSAVSARCFARYSLAHDDKVLPGVKPRSLEERTGENALPKENPIEPPKIKSHALASFIFFFMPALTVLIFVTLFMFLRELNYGFNLISFIVFAICSVIWTELFLLLAKRGYSKKRVIILSIISAAILAVLFVAEIFIAMPMLAVFPLYLAIAIITPILILCVGRKDKK
jgi:hypothetical protein